MRTMIAVMVLVSSAAPLWAQQTGTRPERLPVRATAAGRGQLMQTPRAWIGIAFSCSDCSYQQEDAGARWTFTSPPEVYSVEPGSPAYNAGIRRGDVLTHIADQLITSEPGGRLWAQIKPGDVVNLRYRRGNATRFANFTAAEPRGPQGAVASRRALEEMRALEARAESMQVSSRALLAEQARLAETQRQSEEAQEARRRALQEYLRQLPQGEQRRAEEVLNSILQEQRRMQDTERRQFEELVRASRAAERMYAYRDSTNAVLRGTVAPSAAGGEPRLRFSGTIGGTDVEVRGVSPVTVEETPDELLIRVGDTLVRLKRQPPRR